MIQHKITKHWHTPAWLEWFSTQPGPHQKQRSDATCLCSLEGLHHPRRNVGWPCVKFQACNRPMGHLNWLVLNPQPIAHFFARHLIIPHLLVFGVPPFQISFLEFWKGENHQLFVGGYVIDTCIDVYSPYATFRKHLSGRNLKRLVSVLSAANTVNVLSFKPGLLGMVKDWGTVHFFLTLATWDSGKGFQLVYQALLFLHSCPHFILPCCSSPPPVNKNTSRQHQSQLLVRSTKNTQKRVNFVTASTNISESKFHSQAKLVSTHQRQQNFLIQTEGTSSCLYPDKEGRSFLPLQIPLVNDITVFLTHASFRLATEWEMAGAPESMRMVRNPKGWCFLAPLILIGTPGKIQVGSKYS